MESTLEIPLRLYSEGKVSFYSTDLDKLSRMGIPYTKAPVFYNPKMKLNRDVTITVFSSLGFKTAADLMAASGVRILRLMIEGGADEGIAADSNCLAVHVIKMNARLNGVRNLKVFCSDARLVAERMSWEGLRVEFVDLDPFGSPAPYLDSFLRAVRRGGVLGVTATDTPPLFGIYPDKLLRYYGVYGRKMPFHKEFGIRSLISLIVRVAGRLDLEARPILSYGREHYVRIFLRIDRSPTRSSKLINKGLGWVEVCDGDYKIIEGSQPPERSCPGEVLGPIWVGELSSTEFLEGLDPINEEVRSLISQLRQEAEGPPLYFMLDEIASSLRTRVPKIGRVIDELRDMGHFACRTHIEPLGLKTTASRKELEEVILKLTAS